MGRAAIIDLSALDESLKSLEETVGKLRVIVDRTSRGVPLRYEEENGVEGTTEWKKGAASLLGRYDEAVVRLLPDLVIGESKIGAFERYVDNHVRQEGRDEN